MNIKKIINVLRAFKLSFITALISTKTAVKSIDDKPLMVEINKFSAKVVNFINKAFKTSNTKEPTYTDLLTELMNLVGAIVVSLLAFAVTMLLALSAGVIIGIILRIITTFATRLIGTILSMFSHLINLLGVETDVFQDKGMIQTALLYFKETFQKSINVFSVSLKRIVPDAAENFRIPFQEIYTVLETGFLKMTNKGFFANLFSKAPTKLENLKEIISATVKQVFNAFKQLMLDMINGVQEIIPEIMFSMDTIKDFLLIYGKTFLKTSKQLLGKV